MGEETDNFFRKFAEQTLAKHGDSMTGALSKNKTCHYLFSVSYSSPTYIDVYLLSAISALTNMGHNVTMLLHDNNILAYKHVKRLALNRSRSSLNKHVEGIIEEINAILFALKAIKERVRIIRSSDIWAAISQNKNDFFTFYALLGDIKLQRITEQEGKLYASQYNDAAYHAIRKPFDIYFAENMSRLLKNDGWGNPDFLVVSSNAAETYKYIMQKTNALHATRANRSGPHLSLCYIKHIPRLQYDDSFPSCNMSAEEILEIIKKVGMSDAERSNISSLFLSPLADLLENLSIVKLTAIPKSPSDYETAQILCTLLNAISDKAKDCSIDGPSDVVVSSNFNFQELRSIFSSKAMLKTLFYCNGKLTNSDISRKLNLQLSNVSFYVNKMRKLGLVTLDQKPKIKFNRLIVEVGVLQNKQRA